MSTLESQTVSSLFVFFLFFSFPLSSPLPSSPLLFFSFLSFIFYLLCSFFIFKATVLLSGVASSISDLTDGLLSSTHMDRALTFVWVRPMLSGGVIGDCRSHPSPPLVALYLQVPAQGSRVASRCGGEAAGMARAAEHRGLA